MPAKQFFAMALVALAAPATAGAMQITPMRGGENAIVRTARNVGRESARKSGETFVSAGSAAAAEWGRRSPVRSVCDSRGFTAEESLGQRNFATAPTTLI